MLAPTPLWDLSERQARYQATARRWAFLLGLCLPLSSGLDLSTWIPGYPDQATVIRVVTFVALLWLAGHSFGAPLPKAPARMLQAFALVMSYGAVSLLWAPDPLHGLHDLVTIGSASLTAVAVILTVRGDVRALRAFAVGVLIAGGLQVVIAIGEVSFGRHLSLKFGAEYVARLSLVSIEQLVGRSAWGSMGNPNDLGSFWLLVTAVCLSLGAFGLRLRLPRLILVGATLAASVAIGLTSLNDARAYRLGVVLLIGMYAVDRLLTPGRSALRAPVVLLAWWGSVAMALLLGGALISAIDDTSDAIRLDLMVSGFRSALLSGGFGLGLGAEKAMIDTGQIPMNFHNVGIQLAAELGFVIASAYVAYLVYVVTTWAFVTRSAREIGSEAAIARAMIAVALLIYGITSSGVLAAPDYWTFFAVTAVLAGPPSSTAGSDAHRDARGPINGLSVDTGAQKAKHPLQTPDLRPGPSTFPMPFARAPAPRRWP